MKPRHIWIILSIVIIIFLGTKFINRGQASKAGLEVRVVPVVTITPHPQTITDTFSLTGDVKGQMETVVKPAIGGRIAEIMVDEGQQIKAGQPLLSYVAGIKPSDELYNDMVIFSPVSGLVGVKYVEVGDQISPNNPIFSIYNLDRVKIYVDVPEKYYSHIHFNSLAKISLDAIPDRVFTGRVGNIRPVIDPLTRTSHVEILLNNPGHRIKPGMFANVDLIIQEKQHALVVPFDAVMGEIEKYVFVNQAGIARKKLVSLGILSGNQIEIISGLTSQDEVITIGQRVVHDGGSIKVQAQ